MRWLGFLREYRGFNGRWIACGGVMAVAAIFLLAGPARGAVIYSGLLNTAIPNDFDGVTFNIDGGILNMFFGGVGVANSDTLQPYRDGTGNMDTLINFTVGTTIDASTIYLATGYGGSEDHVGTSFTAGEEGYIGFKLNGTDYGWVRVLFTDNTGGAMVLEWAYGDSGEAITVGGVRQVGQDILLTSAMELGSQLVDVGGATNVIKSGSGNVVLTGNNSYTGSTSVNGGTLTLAAGASLSGTSGLTVLSGATLAGAGTISGASTIDGSATHAPGVSVQSFSSDLSYLSNSILTWSLMDHNDLAGSRGSSFGGVDVAGLLSIASGSGSHLVFNAAGSTVNWANSFWTSNHSWLVYDNGSSPTLGSGSIFDSISVTDDSLGQSFNITGGSFTWSVQGNDIYLNYVIPEPGPCVWWVMAGLVVLMRRRVPARSM